MFQPIAGGGWLIFRVFQIKPPCDSTLSHLEMPNMWEIHCEDLWWNFIMFFGRFDRWTSLSGCLRKSSPGHEIPDYLLAPRAAPQGCFIPHVSAQACFLCFGPLTAPSTMEKLWPWDSYCPFQLTWFYKIHHVSAVIYLYCPWSCLCRKCVLYYFRWNWYSLKETSKEICLCKLNLFLCSFPVRLPHSQLMETLQ